MTYALKFVALSLVLAAPASAAAAAPKTAVPDQTKYCLEYENGTGSRIGHIECRTKAEWAKLGVDVDELMKK